MGPPFVPMNMEATPSLGLGINSVFIDAVKGYMMLTLGPEMCKGTLKDTGKGTEELLHHASIVIGSATYDCFDKDGKNHTYAEKRKAVKDLLTSGGTMDAHPNSVAECKIAASIAGPCEAAMRTAEVTQATSGDTTSEYRLEDLTLHKELTAKPPSAPRRQT